MLFLYILIYITENLFKQYNLCAGTVIDKNWILTSAKCCKRDDIVTIKFNDYSVFYADDDEKEIISTLFHVHKDLDACLIRTAADMSEIVDTIPCITKVLVKVKLKISDQYNIGNTRTNEMLLFRISTLNYKAVLDVGIQDGEVTQ